MRERKFVDQNIEKWAQIEQNLKRKKKDPEELRKELIQVTDDLSFARTFYRNRSVRVYLNGLAQTVYLKLYTTRKPVWSSVRSFFVQDVPKILYFSRKELFVSFLVLLVSIAIGVFSSAKDASFSKSILGEDYVNMTIENIRNGNPLGVYKQDDQISMFYSIARNNLEVGLKVFLFGLIASYGAMVIMVSNGIALGVFIYFFYSRNLVSEFNYTVWMHGSIEILTLVVETLAGILLGRGLIYPGTLSRPKAFAVWGRRAAMVYLSTIPLVLFAAFIESFLTRYTDMPNFLRLMLIISSVAFMLFYFVWYPFKKYRNSEDLDLGMPELKPEVEMEFNPYNILNTGEIFIQTVQFLGGKLKRVLAFCVFTSVLILIFHFAIQQFSYINLFSVMEEDLINLLAEASGFHFSKAHSLFDNLSTVFNSSRSIILYVINSLWMGGILLFVLFEFKRRFSTIQLDVKKALAYIFIFSFSFNLVFLQNSFLIKCLAFSISPLLISIIVDQSFILDKGLLYGKMKLMLGRNFVRFGGVLLVFLMCLFMGTLLIVSPFSFVCINFLEMNFNFSFETGELIAKLIMSLTALLLSSFGLLFFFTQCVFLSFTLNEIVGAKSIFNRIELMGKKAKVYGIETE